MSVRHGRWGGWALRLALVVVLVAAGLVRDTRAAAQEPEPQPDAVVLEDDPDWLALQEWVSALRGLPRLRPVPRVLLSPQAFRERQAAIYRAYLDPVELERTQRVLVRLGVLDPDEDLATAVVSLYNVLPIGLYDPAAGALYVRGTDSRGVVERLILAHEYTHALQDQHFGLGRLYPPPPNADRDAAVGALVEGDALLVQEMYRLTTQPPTEEERAVEAAVWEEALATVYVEVGQLIDWATVPAPVVQQLYFPYLDGPRWIQAVVGEDPLTTFGAYGPAVDALFRRPPQSTSQILHPEKYLANVQPQPVELPELASVLGDDWHVLRRQVMGELEHRRLLGRYLPQDDADAGAAGWAGNRLVVLVNGADELASVSATRWDDADAAGAFVAAYRQWAAARDDAKLVWAEAGRLIWEAPDGALLLEQRGDLTVLINSPTVAIAEALADRARAGRLAAVVPSPLRALACWRPLRQGACPW
ncbi:MAG: hypothetical protein IRZ14_14450 [Chloroflexi bacterium]|nr:hypothetical protein [Chloroflexota bacterium]